VFQDRKIVTPKGTHTAQVSLLTLDVSHVGDVDFVDFDVTPFLVRV